MKIAGQLEVTINVDGQEIAYPSIGSSILQNQNVNVALPSIKLNLIDAGEVLDKLVPVNDGSILIVRVGDAVNPATETRYRVFGTPLRKPNNNMVEYTIQGLLDAVPYVRANPSQAYQGTSVEVMGEICKAMDFKLVHNMNTNDSMNWLPGRKTWYGYARMLSDHGRVDDKSALHIAVSNNRELHYNDVTQLYINGQIKKTLYYGKTPSDSQGDITEVDDYTAENHSGLLNNLAGYGLRISQSNVLTGLVQKFSNVNAMKINNVVDINKAVLGQIGSRGRIDLPRIGTGNTYPQFMQSLHQNTRIRATYSQTVYVLLSHASNLNLFDMVNFSAIRASGTDNSVGGLYCVTAITTVVHNRRYKEKIQLTSAGPQNENKELI